MQPLELTGNRTLAFKVGDRLYHFTLSQITPEMWLRYFDGIVSSSESRGREQVNDYDETTAMAALVRSAVLKARGQGYDESAMGAGCGVRLAHCEQIGKLLARVGAAADTGDVGVVGLDEARLEAVWNCDDAGVLRLHRPLLHRFATPTFDHERKFMRARGRSKVVGGSRTGKTIWMGTQRVLLELYDELIREVEGYTSGGKTLGNTGAIVAEMDAYHKVVAGQMLFQVPAQPEEAEAAEEEVA